VHAQSTAPDKGITDGVPIDEPFNRPTGIEVANERLGSAAAYKLPPQPYMHEVYWRDVMGREFPADTPPFIRDSLLQIVAPSYYMTRDNLDGTQAWAAGGWIAYGQA